MPEHAYSPASRPAATVLTFVVNGDPVPQPRHRVTVRAGHGHAYIPADHPVHPFRAAVTMTARAAAAAARWERTTGPVVVVVTSIFDRQPSHVTRAGTPRASAPVFPATGDWDNLGKAVCDAITDAGNVWRDDRQVVDGRVRKRYARHGEAARTVVTITIGGVDDEDADRCGGVPDIRDVCRRCITHRNSGDVRRPDSPDIR